MHYIKKLSVLALTALTFVSAPALADDDWDDDDHYPRTTQVKQHQVAAPKISRERAVSIAKNRFKGAYVTDVDLERKRGRAYYDVELRDKRYEYEVRVDAQTGEILRTRKDFDD